MAHPDVEKILVTAEEISERCKELGELITEDYKDHPPVLVALLKGSVPFLAELMKYIDLDVQIDFMDVTSYSGTESSGDVRILKDTEGSVQGKDILLIEDIVDTGRTLVTVKDLLYSKGARSVAVATLLDKPDRRVVEIHAEYVGFEIPNEFVIGFGLDFNQRFRNLPYVGVLKEDCYKE